jgi:hypothetical protein
MSDTFEELRIIATERGALSSHDRNLLRIAADEMETVYKVLMATQGKLIESQQQRIALNERLLEAKRGVPETNMLAGYSSGWIRCELRGWPVQP